jgi:hypothetical protein
MPSSSYSTYIIIKPCKVTVTTVHVVAIHHDARSDCRHSTSHHYKATRSFPASKAIYISLGISITGPTTAEYLAGEASFPSRW